MTVTWLVAGRTGPNAARIMSKVHDMWVNSLAALLGALAAIRSLIRHIAVSEVMSKVGHTGDGEPTHSHEERYGSRTWGDSTHKQACLQAIAVATVNATYDWMANKARRTLEDVLDVRAHDRRP